MNETTLAALGQLGVTGIVLGWFMLRQESQNKDIVQGQSFLEAAINRLSKAMLLMQIERPDTPPSVKRLAQDLSSEVDEAEKERRYRSSSRAGRSSPSPS